MIPDDTLAKRVADFLNVATKPGVMKKVKDEFPNLPPDHLHIIVDIPPGE